MVIISLLNHAQDIHLHPTVLSPCVDPAVLKDPNGNISLKPLIYKKKEKKNPYLFTS